MKSILAIVALLGVSATAKADIFVEPYANYQLATFKVQSVSGTTKGNANGSNLGARIGGASNMLFIGADYAKSFGASYKYTSGSTGSGDADSSNLYGVIGADLPLIRLWIGYGLMNELKLKVTGGDLAYSGGTHIKAGIGLNLFPMVSINVEYITDDYKKMKYLGTESTLPVSGGTQKVTSSGFTVGLSVPLDF